MKKAEIDRKFDEIVGFAEVEKFLDTPVKHYSSGMHVRLAFAVAAHLQPEILLIDEVLAVGDIEFQKKCIGRMEKVAHEGRTVAVVSHSMATIRALCERAILLEGGRVKVVGSAEAAVNEYLRANAPDTAEKVITDEEHDSRGGDKIRLRRVKLLNAASNCFAVYWRQPIMIRLEIEVREPLEGVSFGAGICLPDGGQILTVHHDDEPSVPQWEFAPSTYAIELTIENNLRPGIYRLHVGAHQKFFNLRNLFYVDPVTFEVLDHTQEGVVPLGSNTGLVNGRAGWGQPQRIEGGVHTSVA
jgi:energy-coupling factor transporter ATP-binding protein EcfA2